ncbi:hypothetical protein ACFQZX_16990 [Mucilaginibacter litoreus]|uniref:Uncharacterized protein n=1 Tax=Mucilaginibacter litoreus TaxID=1048221 RepID=A0ABW3AXR0_9SPHI
MNTKIIMAASALFLALTGMVLTFFPQEILTYLDAGTNVYFKLSIQLIGALYFAFAIVNWMAKGNIIGGIYNRPMVMGNLAHFFIGGMAVTKALLASALPGLFWIFAGLYLRFAILFAILFNRHPTENQLN